ncbi:DegT/DnrJ/EryC1/StrS family aminotransferase [Flavobacterium quisquiliarum]|uniref:DegT/DnrJ/EryC1/StrS family aminotransferase n=1 Tax=Flavobacterium quisquiliarum TaxID=1834436 RepID=A0ABV8WCW4_9FLAO|nr:DegT/DnrJ/EryC1/StrS family aminotransferase [Flavobacterium quisquiliarum]MBW1657711.1 DegT/DnrJ/EryC1/StrS family aminotransferase [Flavobacterium quisquiliarum]NWL04050.1 aminotransferase DegT [Flavobacterium collinsii]
MINVTKTFFPPVEEYTKFIKRAWDNEWLTNRGELVLELEEKIKKYLEISNIIITNNGTVPLQIALKLLGNRGEIITTPFSYVATTASIVWENCIPVFVDIHPEYFTIDETKIEHSITPKTTAILATHVFGNPCNILAIESIAKKYNLKVIYDAAHSFGVKFNDKSIFEYGDVSTCSFHATKIFHTGEGGAMITKDQDLHNKLYFSHNFGHNGPLEFYGLGINGKMSELQAAMGLSILPYMDEIISERKRVVDYYNTNLDLEKIQVIKIRPNTVWNYSYYPVVFKSEYQLLEVQKALNDEGIFPRRYFYPSLNTVEYTNGGKMPISENIASRIVCLPLYVDLSLENLKKIVSLINNNIC